MDMPEHQDPCSHCGEEGTFRCAACKSVRYCSKECQKADWGQGHKKECKGKKNTKKPKINIQGSWSEARPSDFGGVSPFYHMDQMFRDMHNQVGEQEEPEPADVLTCEEVEQRLSALGVNVKKASGCVKKAIQKGFIKIKGEDKKELQQVVMKQRSDACDHIIKATLAEVMYQPDFVGIDYSLADANITVVCHGCIKDGKGNQWPTYHRQLVSWLCTGSPTSDNGHGKFHNHCNKCPGFGKCLRDHRMAHCDKCGSHYWCGRAGSNFPCDKCQSK